MPESLQKVQPAVQACEGNEFDVKHAGIAKKQLNGILVRGVAIDRDAYKAALDWWIDGEDEISKDRIS